MWRPIRAFYWDKVNTQTNMPTLTTTLLIFYLSVFFVFVIPAGLSETEGDRAVILDRR